MAGLSNEELIARTREFESDIRKHKGQLTRLTNEIKDLDLRLKENKERLNLSTQLPHMVANVGEILDCDSDDDTGDKDASGFNYEANQASKKALIVKTTGRHTIYLPVIGMVEAD